jgi:hypothetical protein
MLQPQPSDRTRARRYEDNGDAVNNLVVISQKTDKNSITGYGGPDKFLNEFSYLLGKQVFSGECSRPFSAWHASFRSSCICVDPWSASLTLQT